MIIRGVPIMLFGFRSQTIQANSIEITVFCLKGSPRISFTEFEAPFIGYNKIEKRYRGTRENSITYCTTFGVFTASWLRFRCVTYCTNFLWFWKGRKSVNWAFISRLNRTDVCTALNRNDHITVI